MRCRAQKSINSHQGHPRLPPTQRDGNTVGPPLVHRSPAEYQRWTNPDLSAQTARAAVRRSVGRGGVSTLSRVIHRNGTARRMPGRRPGRRGEPEPGEHRRDRLWHAVGKDRSHRLGFGGPQVGGSGGVIGGVCSEIRSAPPRGERSRKVRRLPGRSISCVRTLLTNTSLLNRQVIDSFLANLLRLIFCGDL